jgi:formamidopyrimidine-DNA glycosylase
VNVIGGKFIKTPPVNVPQVRLTFTGVRCKGKMLIFDFKNTALKMFAGLGMTGQFVFERDAHSALEFVLEAPPPFPKAMYFTDMRRFGNVSFSTEDQSSKLAPSILSCGEMKEIQQEDFIKRAKTLQKRTSRDIIGVLMDQQEKTGVCSGIGNYLIAEILYHSRINPFRPFNSLNEDELTRIHYHSLLIASESFSKQGMTVSDFVSPMGESGQYQQFLHVYSRKKTPDGDTVVAAKGSHGRTIWWVPKKQV